MGWGLLYQECYSYILNLELELMMVLMLFYDKALKQLDTTDHENTNVPFASKCMLCTYKYVFCKSDLNFQIGGRPYLM